MHGFRKILQRIFRVHILFFFIINRTARPHNTLSETDLEKVFILAFSFKKPIVKILNKRHIIVQRWIHILCDRFLPLPQMYNLILPIRQIFQIYLFSSFFFFLSFISFKTVTVVLTDIVAAK